MSVGSYNNEDIRNLIYQAPPPDEKFPMYHSKFSKKVREDTKKVKSCHKTFGYAEVPLDPPSNFLKKKTRMVRRPFVGMHSFVKEFQTYFEQPLIVGPSWLIFFELTKTNIVFK